MTRLRTRRMNTGRECWVINLMFLSMDTHLAEVLELSSASSPQQMKDLHVMALSKSLPMACLIVSRKKYIPLESLCWKAQTVDCVFIYLSCKPFFSRCLPPSREKQQSSTCTYIQ